MQGFISRQAAIDIVEFECGEWSGLARTIVKAIKQLPSAQPDVPEMNVGDMISRQAATTIPVMPKEHRHYQTNNLDDAYEQGWTDLQECIENLPPVQPTIMRSIGKLIGYTGNKCPNCGRLRVERYESGLEICEKCNWCEQTKSYWLDGV